MPPTAWPLPREVREIETLIEPLRRVAVLGRLELLDTLILLLDLLGVPDIAR